MSADALRRHPIAALTDDVLPAEPGRTSGGKGSGSARRTPTG